MPKPIQSPHSDLAYHVMFHKGTEPAFSGEYTDTFQSGIYVCAHCHTPLYRSGDKFHSGCGWPSFDDEIPHAVKRQRDADGKRIEIQCAHCGIHLGHVFEGEGFTQKNTRHCVNSVSLTFKPDIHMGEGGDTSNHRLIVGCGCFWGVEFWFMRKYGVLSTQVGYSGGEMQDPTYEQVCSGTTGHFEVVEIEYDVTKVSVRELLQYFFEIHDFEQKNGQGNDIGEQYKSVIFYKTDEEKKISEDIILELRKKGYHVATMLLPASPFYPAETYHQKYYAKHNASPYCHLHRPIF